MSAPDDSLLFLLLNELFDYAGMFPPASLSFEAAVAESACLHQTLTRPWLVGSDLVLDTVNARALAQRSPAEWGFSRTPRISLLATEEPAHVLAVASLLLNQRYSSAPYTVSSLEIRVQAQEVATVIATYRDFAERHSCILAIEPDLSTHSWREELARCLQLIEQQRLLYSSIALKVRCSGPTGLNPHKLATAIAATCDQRLHLKTTAGLHHPIVESAVYGNTFGFLNLALAVMLRRTLGEGAPIDMLERIITNDSVQRLQLTAALGFESLAISREELIAAKDSARLSIGSCSLTEPDADLTRLWPGL
jgi:hypothetical protein